MSALGYVVGGPQAVVEALLERTAHSIEVGGTEFVVSGTEAPRDGTLREIYGRLAPVAIIRGDNSPDAGEVIACPSLDTEVTLPAARSSRVPASRLISPCGAFRMPACRMARV